MSAAPPSEVFAGAGTYGRLKQMVRGLYRAVGYLGLMSIFGSQLYGFRYDAHASATSFAVNLLLYAAFIVPHLLMTRSWFKRAVWGAPAGSAAERRVYILVSIGTWFAVFALHRPMPGGELAPGSGVAVLQFVGDLIFLWSVVLFFQGVTFEMLDGLLGVPGAVEQFSHGAETPLLSEGPYAEVRHPMYRAAILVGLSSLAIHPNVAQLFWVAAIAASFIGFIPVEEAQMIAARGDDYRRYQARTPYRLFRGIW
jgi:protein-S-isoprenylcysteine O-methyltransferase Ste14